MSDPIVDLSHEMIRRGSKSFATAASLFDTATRERAWMLYAWCRHCDDQIDGQDLGFGTFSMSSAERQARLENLRTQTRAAFNAEAVHDPVFAAFQRVARESAIPERHALELLEGFAMDVRGDAYADIEQTLLYCYRVAGVVGVMMAYVMGAREPRVLARAADLGIAFQLTNIARDVLDDAANGRCYLPAALLAESGVPDGAAADPAQREGVAQVVRRMLDIADRYYASARIGLADLPLRSAWAVATALGVYREIGEIVRERGASAWNSRAMVSRPRRAWHGIRGFLTAARAVLLRDWRTAQPRERGLWMVAELRED
ncbi:MAG: phytoene/squalene synthase family protein [Gammaproteobacteria bacterium]|nr:phytoene/squalene synthase family protein [Gammaproteobacteria bacterium]